MPPLAPPLVAVAGALVFARGHVAAAALIAGVLGSLIGASLPALPAALAMPEGVLSIGGAGVYESILLTGLIALLLT